MFKYYFEGIKNVEIFPIISLIIFFTFFLGMIVWLLVMKKSYVDKMKNMPLQSEDEPNESKSFLL
ncbi:MAG: cytochrome C oxidase Cbb3 [Microscillaceae bacterium]|nr:cytochrome C oxidase Cbb3 [Microscillaceae bacterium]